MTNEELNTELYKKLFAEQEKFKAWAKDAPVPNDYNAWGGRRTHEYVLKLIRGLSICSSTVSERNRRRQKRKSRLFSKS